MTNRSFPTCRLSPERSSDGSRSLRSVCPQIFPDIDITHPAPTTFASFPAIPHRLMEDDVYNGYFLPKDSIVLGNAWCAAPCPPCPPVVQRTRLTDLRLCLCLCLTFQGDLARRQALPRSLHIQTGTLYRPRRGPARPRRRGLRFRLWAARLPRPLDGPRLRLDRGGERALLLPHRKGRARRPGHRTHRCIHSWHPRVRSFFFFFVFFFFLAMAYSTRTLSYRSPEKFECSVKARSKDAEALVRSTSSA